MLFTDATILTIPELREHDNFVLDVASTESIELGSKLAIAQREIGLEIAAFLQTRRIAAGLGQVVVTEALRDLLAKHTLANVYRDAYNLHLNDRYLGRWKEFTRSSERGLLRLLQTGIGMAGVSIAQAELPTVTLSGSGSLPSGSYFVQIAWQNATGSAGERSTAVPVDVSSGRIVIQPGNASANASGWNCYIGTQESAVKRQNEAPLTPESPWVQAGPLREDLRGPETTGPDYYVRNSGQLLRG